MAVSPSILVSRCVLLVLSLLLTGCYSASTESLPSRYTVRFEWGESTLELHKDGTFAEEAMVSDGNDGRLFRILVENGITPMQTAKTRLMSHKGGELIACGTPEQVAACKASHTGRFLAKILRKKANVQNHQA